MDTHNSPMQNRTNRTSRQSQPRNIQMCVFTDEKKDDNSVCNCRDNLLAEPQALVLIEMSGFEIAFLRHRPLPTLRSLRSQRCGGVLSQLQAQSHTEGSEEPSSQPFHNLFRLQSCLLQRVAAASCFFKETVGSGRQPCAASRLSIGFMQAQSENSAPTDRRGFSFL